LKRDQRAAQLKEDRTDTQKWGKIELMAVSQISGIHLFFCCFIPPNRINRARYFYLHQELKDFI
jgi:hypothetical protein